MFAQSVAEYGALASAKTTLQSFAYSFRGWVSQLSTTTWIVVGGAVILLFWLRRR